MKERAQVGSRDNFPREAGEGPELELTGQGGGSRSGMAGDDPGNGKSMCTGLAIKRIIRPSGAGSFPALAMVNQLVFLGAWPG